MPGEVATVVVEVLSIKSRQVRRRGMKPMVEARVSDETGTMSVVFFNQPWLERRYRPGTRLLLTGKLAPPPRRGFNVTDHAETGDQVTTGEDMATYPASDGLTSVQIAALVHEHKARMRDVLEPLPARIRALERLPDRTAALDAAHFGDQEGGRRRLAFDEFLLLQIALLRRRALRREGARAERLEPPGELTARWLAAQPPVHAHRRPDTRDGDGRRDIAQDRPMQRLLMGEVGSGKTVVALYAMLRAVESGAQAALMAPTETLAEQHFATLQKLMPGELVQAALLTGSTPAGPPQRPPRQARDRRAEAARRHPRADRGRRSSSTGSPSPSWTSSTASASTSAARWTARRQPGLAPHILHMTATPIPRTLALTAYGDLDVTTLHELPAGRRPIVTHVAATDAERARAYERIREELDKGRQAFVVCPLVEESEALQARAATAEYERLQRRRAQGLPRRADARPDAPAGEAGGDGAFAAGGADVLVATTVIEVGIDVPNATVMLVEDAERYGLSQLHQLRGPDRPRRARVGLPALRPEGLPPPEGDGPAHRRLQARRDRPRAARRGGDARRPPVRDAGVQVRPPARGRRAARARPPPRPRDPRRTTRTCSEPEHALIEDAIVRTYGPDALEPIPA